MGMFRRIARENQRNLEGIRKTPELEQALQILMQAFSDIQNPTSPNHEQANSAEYLKKVVRLSQTRRDEAIKLNLYEFAAIFSSIHCRVFLKLNRGTLLGAGQTEIVLGLYGNSDLHSLHSDVRYLAWGVNKAGVDPREYWDCKEMVDMYQSRIIDFAQSKVVDDSITVLDDFAFPPTPVVVRWFDYKRNLLPPTNVLTPHVPAIED
jgi:hypothetical protein